MIYTAFAGHVGANFSSRIYQIFLLFSLIGAPDPFEAGPSVEAMWDARTVERKLKEQYGRDRMCYHFRYH